MQTSQEVQKLIFPIKLVWLALVLSIFVYGIMLISVGKTGMVDLKTFTNIKTLLFPICFIPFVFTTLFSRKLNLIIRKTDMEKAPFAKHMQAEDKVTLRYYSSYFLIHIIMWFSNEAGAIFGLILSFVTGNAFYYLCTGGVALFINLFLLKPDYLKFLEGKKLE